ncbi:MAG: DUF2294 domain-containing protein [Oculatellaceae cyanobacterium bins.114]|nr:DUF2294 domain-containing protein [Oculatellaceae cyanobacterium bins.114]
MQASDPTRGQLERSLAQGIEALYRRELGHRPTKVSCRIFDEKIAIVLEEAITQPELLLANSGQEELAEQIRVDLDKALRPQLIQLIEDIVAVKVTDLLSDATLETGRTGTIAILSEPPQIRVNSDPKIKKPKASESETDEA